ncbi:MAG: glycoside hydrolase family 2 TIM barrel-domain containing protein, partial [Agathobacter rectalis]
MQCHNFNEDWTFEKADQADRLKAFYGNSNAVAVTLPHDAMIREKRDKDCPSGAQSGFYPGGVYTYEKKFMAQNEWKKQDVFLEFEGIYGIARVWINGSLAAVNRNGYMGFSVDLKPWISYEHENIIRIDVDNSKQPNSRWYSGSGIYRDVNLWTGKGVYISHDKLRITTLSVNDDMAVIEVCAQLKNIIGHGLEAECLIEIKKDGQKTASDTQRVVFRSEQMQTVRVQIPIEHPKKWSPKQPALYECHITTKFDDKICDEAVSNFGIRVLALDPVHGLQINGETVKLRGTCIHHDNGVIGAETFKEAEWYRCKRLKEAGFNAIRSAHHPMSRAMLDACDHIGILVMDELTDMWDKEKNTYDFSDIFEDEYNQWINHMVEKDYNHPSVIIYSVGNEIQEAGTKQGAWINRMLCNKFHELDNTRYTTNALNGLNCAGRRLGFIMRDVAEKFGMDSHGSGSGGGSNALNSFMSLMSGEKGEFFAKHPLVSEALEECSQSCDITGLNYLSGRYELEHELHPAKTVLGTETYPADIENLWKLVKTYPHVIGDFTWTGYDYIGEAGVGIFHYDGNANFTSIYPERLGYIGDIDLIGNRRPISYFREIVYGLTDKPYIAVERLEHAGQTAGKT